jgi:hypothetical protein
MNNSRAENQTNNPTDFKLSQIDFYSILSPKVRPGGHDLDVHADARDEVHNQMTQDLEIQAKLHGFSEPVNFSTVASYIDGEPIPLRSIRIPLHKGMLMAWAPNGYGKTYMFEKLLSSIPSIPGSLGLGISAYINYFHELRNGLEAGRNVNFKETTTFPFHGMGLRLESNENVFEILYFLPERQALETEDEQVIIMWSERGCDSETENEPWIYSPGKSWQREEWSSSRASLYSKSNHIASIALDKWGQLRSTYIETPKLGSSTEFHASMVEFIEDPLYGDDPTKKLRFYSHELQNGSTPLYSGFNGRFNVDLRLRDVNDYLTTFNPPEADEHLLNILAALCDRLTFFTDSLSIGLIDLEVENQRIEALLEHFADSLPHTIQYEETQTLVVQLEGLRVMQGKLNDILFTWSDFNREKRLQCFDFMLDEVGKNCEKVHSPWLKKVHEMMLVLRLHYMSELIHSGQLQPIELEGYLERCRRATSSYVHYRIALVQQFFGIEHHEEEPDASTIFHKELDFSKFNDIEYIVQKAWPWMLYNAVVPPNRADFEMLDFLPPEIQPGYAYWPRIFDSHDAASTLLAELNGIGEDANPNLPGWDFFPQFKPHYGNAYLALLAMNENLNPPSSPWGVEVYLNTQHHVGERPPKDDSEVEFSYPIRFHRQGDEDDSILAEFLSFGMRSELILQLALFKFIVNNRQQQVPRRPTGSPQHQFDLLILDESEVGRSEYWTQLLINRFRRLEFQIQGATNAQVLVVSHRGLVLEDSTESSIHFVMHRIPNGVEADEEE